MIDTGGTYWRGGSQPGEADFVLAWTKALTGTSLVSMAPQQRVQFLRGLAKRLSDALVAEPFDPMVGHLIAVDLVVGGYAAPETLGRAVTVMQARLRPFPGPDTGPSGTDVLDLEDRLVALVEAFVTGYTRALWDRTLDAQDSLRLAAMTASARAEQLMRVAEARMQHAALHDPLTGLPNRTLFSDRLGHMFRRARADIRLGLCFIDIDDFKSVNDSLGHGVGDHLITAVAERLGGLARESGHFLARLSGDKFALLVEGTFSAEDAIKVADQALATFTEPFHIDDHALPIRASVGVVERPIAGTDPIELLRAADMTLHWAKTDGKDRWVLFDIDRNTSDVDRYRLSAAMPAALDRDEFTLHYQPLVSLDNGALVGLEALARWHHPTLGMISPGRFISLAESTGLIVRLGIRLLELACRQAVQWYADGANVPLLSVNLAVRQVRDPGLAADIAEVLDRTGMPANRLQLEITESAAMDCQSSPIETLTALANLGVRIAIDDFGTGYSNLVYLRDLPVHGLKLDSGFLRQQSLPRAPDVILTHLVNLGHELGLTVTAEGIQTQAEAERLHRIGCDLGQGWYFGHPAPADTIVSRLPSTTTPAWAG